MRMVQFYLPDGGHRVGVLQGDRVRDLTALDPAVKMTLDLLERSHVQGTTMDGVVEGMLDAAGQVPGYRYDDLHVPPDPSGPHLEMPIYPPEVWGFGVTYKRSAEMRDEDSASTIYDYAYSAERPELFFKATCSRCVGPQGPVGIRCDSTLTATEPELAYVLGYDEEIVGYTCCNDVSAWDIERENPLYLPQSKIFEGCCAIGPVLATPADIPNPRDLGITCRMYREGTRIYEGYVHSSQIRRSFEEMTGFLCRNNPVPPGTVVSTGTGIMVPNDLPMQEGDRVEIEIEGIGVLTNVVRRLSS